MGKRREGREAAVQYLFQRDLNATEAPQALAHFWDLRPGSPATREFANALIQGVIAQLPEIDARIKKFTANYELGRIAAVDRNILRLAIFEMVFANDVPPVVAINEAIEIAKRFGSEESGRFVNGVLDRVKNELSRPLR